MSGANGFDAGDAYARAALDRECSAASAARSGRNEQLNKSARALGQLVGAGALDRREVEERLFAASQANGYVAKDGAPAARATIKSGLESGIRAPREVPERRASGRRSQTSSRPTSPPSTVTPLKPAPRLTDVPLPAWTPPGSDGKPKFFALGKSSIESVKDEIRRHEYRRDGQVIRVKVKLATGAWLDFYKVERTGDGAVGWQGKKPAGFVPMAYFGGPEAFDPFDPEHRSEPLLWHEGEKDVETAAAAGLFGFTFGSATEVPEAMPQLEGRDIVVLAHNDEPGLRSADRRAALASRSAASVKVVTFPELPPGGDVSDWLQQGGTAQALLARARPVDPAKADGPVQAYRPRPSLSDQPPLGGPGRMLVQGWSGC